MEILNPQKLQDLNEKEPIYTKIIIAGGVNVGKTLFMKRINIIKKGEEFNNENFDEIIFLPLIVNIPHFFLKLKINDIKFKFGMFLDKIDLKIKFIIQQGVQEQFYYFMILVIEIHFLKLKNYILIYINLILNQYMH